MSAIVSCNMIHFYTYPIIPYIQMHIAFMVLNPFCFLVKSETIKNICYHEIVLHYYISTINTTDCQFLATRCDNYKHFKTGKCSSNNSVTADMGFYEKILDGLRPRSTFYLRTKKNPPYC